MKMHAKLMCITRVHMSSPKAKLAAATNYYI